MVHQLKAIRRNFLGSLRYTLMRLKGLNVHVGKGFFVQPYFHMLRRHTLTAGDNVFIGRHAHIGCDLDIGNNVMLASYVSFVGGDHKIDGIGEVPIRYSGRDHDKKAIVQDNVWIGHGAIIMAGCTLASGSVIAAGSVVTRDVGENEIVGGSPAKVIRKRKL